MRSHLVLNYKSRLKSLVIFIIILLVCLMNPSEAWTAEISKVKGTQTLIVDFDGHEGDEYFAVDGSGKKRAIIHIKKARNGRAIGEITKGKAQVGYTITPRGKGGSSKKARHSGKGTMEIGGIFGYSMDSMSVPVLTRTENLSGNGFSAKGVIDYPFSSYLEVRLLAGYESFSAKANQFTTDISYLTLDAIGKFIVLPNSGFDPWIGGGIGFGIPFSKSTNVLAEDSIATSTLVYIAGGSDIAIGSDFSVPFQVDYALFLPASDVKTSILAVRLGAMMKF
jgi:hypothetical protein